MWDKLFKIECELFEIECELFKSKNTELANKIEAVRKEIREAIKLGLKIKKD